MVNLWSSPASAGEESTEIFPWVLLNSQEHFITTDVFISEAKLMGQDAICYLDQTGYSCKKPIFRHTRSSSCSFCSTSFETAWHPLCSGSWYQEQAGKGLLWVADGKWRKKSGKSPSSARLRCTQAPPTPLAPAKAQSVSEVTWRTSSSSQLRPTLLKPVSKHREVDFMPRKRSIFRESEHAVRKLSWQKAATPGRQRQ